MRRERDVPAHQHKFETDSLLVTINGHPELPSSATKKAIHDQVNHAAQNAHCGQRWSVQVHGVEVEDTSTHHPDNNDFIPDNNSVQCAHNAAVNAI